MMVFHIGMLISGAARGSGFRFRIRAFGESVASARAAIVSWKRLTHMSCTAVRTDCPLGFAMAETKTSRTEVKVTVIWNCIFLSVVKIHRSKDSTLRYIPARIS